MDSGNTNHIRIGGEDMKRNKLQKLFVVELVVIFLLAACGSTDKVNKEASTVKPTEKQRQTTNPTTIASATAVSAEENSATSSKESSWTLVNDIKISHTSTIEAFFNETLGVTVGYAGEIHSTEDGGKTWPRSKNESACRFSVDFVSEKLVWCGGNNNQVCVSKDGGKTWTVAGLADMGTMHSNIDFIDDMNGWVATQKRCMATKDGGKTWTKVELPKEADRIAAIALRTPTDGYFLTNAGLLFITKDGGKTWTNKDIGIKNYKIVDTANKPQLVKKDVALADIAFMDENTGYIVFAGSVPGEGNKVFCLKTEDGGSTWNAEEVATADGYIASTVSLTGDGKYLTLRSIDKRLLLLKNTTIK